METNHQTDYFAGGCFWCMSPVFDQVDGVVVTQVGYMGGSASTANYADVCTGQTQHIETIQVTYDPNVVDYVTLLNAFFNAIDPTDSGGQFADRGPQYQPVVFVHHQAQQTQVNRYIQTYKSLSADTIAVTIQSVQPFYPAEGSHQNYYLNHPDHYQAYKDGSGRTAYLNARVFRKIGDNGGT